MLSLGDSQGSRKLNEAQVHLQSNSQFGEREKSHEGESDAKQAITHRASLPFSKLSCVSPWLASGDKTIHMRSVQPSKPHILIEGGRKLRQDMEVG